MSEAVNQGSRCAPAPTQSCMLHMAVKLEDCAGDLRARAREEGRKDLLERAQRLEGYAIEIRSDGCGCGRSPCRFSRIGTLVPV